MEAAARFQKAYQNHVAAGNISDTELSHYRFEAKRHRLKARSVLKYRYRYFDRDLVRSRFSNIKHSIFKTENELPVLAASSFFSVDFKPWGKPFCGGHDQCGTHKPYGNGCNF